MDIGGDVNAMRSYRVRTNQVASEKFHWELYEIIPLGGESGGPGKETLVEKCCSKENATTPCGGFDSAEAAEEDGKHRITQM